ncbi:hypothetical protein [Streptomyces sp. XH2]|uniref:hypothetical protein n=1 Tax=Streptomyces sp. XH2 TaxID=3412483 RepID=UPI003C7A5BBC
MKLAPLLEGIAAVITIGKTPVPPQSAGKRPVWPTRFVLAPSTNSIKPSEPAKHERFDFLALLRMRLWLAEGTEGNDSALDWCAHHVLGLRNGNLWREAVSTTLMSDWVEHRGTEAHVRCGIADLRAQARMIHQQLRPLWRRRANGLRVVLLDTPLGHDVTLYDLVAGSPTPQELALGALPDDPRLTAVLNALTPAERRIALAWVHPAVATWTQAALAAGAADPVKAGERVRRKLKRLGQQHTARLQAAAATRAGAP